MPAPLKTIMLVTDTLRSSAAAAETAANLARRNQARILVVDTIQPPSRAAQWISRNANDVFEMVVADKQDRLDAFADRMRALGLEAESKVLVGGSSNVISQEALDQNVDLVIRYRKGARSKFPGVFGNTARNLMRICPSSLLFVDEHVIDEPRVLACVDASHDDTENVPILDESRRLVARQEDLLGVYCWDCMAADLLSHRLSKDAYQFTLQEAEELYGGIFKRFCDDHNVGDFGERFRMEKGEPSQVIPDICKRENINIVVMSAIALNNPVLRMLGSTVEAVMDRLPCSLLVVKPSGFHCPLKAKSASEG